MDHTNRFKPSKELIQITKRKMDEAKAILTRLEARLKTSTMQSERQAIQLKIDEIKKQYDGYIEDLQSVEEAKAAPLPRVVEPTEPAKIAEEVKKVEEQCAYSPNTLPKQAQAGEQVLKRRLSGQKEATALTTTKWSELQKQQIIEGQKADREAELERQRKADQYRMELGKQAAEEDYKKTHKLELMKTRPKSPVIYQESTFSAIGQNDLKRQREAVAERDKLNKVMLEQTQQDAATKSQTLKLAKTEKQIDLSTGVLPTDRFDANGNVKKIAVPEEFLKGTFANQEPKAPGRVNLVVDHDLKRQQELDDIAEENKLKALQQAREDAVKAAQKAKVEALQKASEDVIKSTQDNVQKVLKQKFGSVPIQTDEQAVKGNFYQTTNRKINKAPDPKKDVVYGEGNFISSMDVADRKRAVGHPQVLPLTEEEIKLSEQKRMLKANPQKAPLDATDVKIIKNYIENALDEQKYQEKLLQERIKYDQELAAFEKTKAAEDPDAMNQKEKAILAAPRMVKAPF